MNKQYYFCLTLVRKKTMTEVLVNEDMDRMNGK